MCMQPDRFRWVENCCTALSKQHLSERFENGTEMTEYDKLFSNRVYVLSYIDVFSRQCIVLDETTVNK